MPVPVQRLAAFYLLAAGSIACGQTHLHRIADDGAWTWLSDPRALFHNGRLYVGHVRGNDGRSTLTAYDPASGTSATLWTSSWTERDDSDNPALLRLQDGRLMAFYARHSNSEFFAYRLSLNTNPITAADWGPEKTLDVIGTVTFANPYQLSAEGGRIYNFIRNTNFNPTFVTSDDLGTNWSAPKILVQTGTGGTRPFIKYASDYTSRIDFIYTDAHPQDVATSLYHAYYENGAFYRSDGSFLKSNAPLLHDAGERGSIIYQYSDAPASDPNESIPAGRAWCWEVIRGTNGDPVSVFTVQRDNVTGPSWSDDRIYYYYARWTGAAWQKRFIAHAGRPLYETEDHYAGGICIDPEDPNVVYLSSNAADPFNTADINNVPLQPSGRYELYRGVTADAGLTFSWTTITSNSVVDNLRPYVPRNAQGQPGVIWFRGTYNAYSSFSTEIVGLLTNEVFFPPTVRIDNPPAGVLQLTNLANSLKLRAVAEDDGHPGALSVQWSTGSGPTNATFTTPLETETLVSFPQSGTYVLRITASDTASTAEAAVTVFAGALPANSADSTRVLWLKLDETSGLTAADSSGNGNAGTLFGGATWLPAGGVRGGALKFNGTAAFAQVLDSPALDNTTAFTLAYWFRIDAWPANNAALVSKREGATTANAYSMFLDAATRRINIDIDGNNDRFTSPPLTNGLWYHVALVYNGTLPVAQRVQLWLNGRLEVTAAETSSFLPRHGSQFRLGWMPATSATYFNGLIDDVRFHRRALSASEIVALSLVNVAPAVAPGAAPAATNGIATRLNGQSSGPATWMQLAGPGDATFEAANPATAITFNRAGDYLFRLTAENSIATVCQDLPITVSPNFHIYEDWIARAFPGVTDPLVISTASDPDGDGQQNFLEFGLASDPAIAGPSSFRIERNPTGSVRIIHPARRDPARTYQILISLDLESWQEADAFLTLDSTTRPPGQDEYEIRTFRLTGVPPTSAFFRLFIK